MKHKIYLFFISFLFVLSMILFIIGIYSKNYFNRIIKVYNISHDVLKNNNAVNIDLKSRDEKYIYEYFKNVNTELSELNNLSYYNYKKEHLNSEFYKNLNVSKNNISLYFQKEEKGIEDLKNKSSKKVFLEYLKSNNVSESVILYLDNNLDDEIFDTSNIAERINYDQKEFNSLLEYIDYLNEEKNNWSLKNGNIVSDKEKLITDIKNENNKLGININVLKEKEEIKAQDNIIDDNSKRIPVLMYHGVSDETWGIKNLFIKASDFENQMKYIHDNYETIFIEDIEKDYSNKKVVVLTFDDGYVDFYINIFPLLKKYNLKANLYIIVNSMGGKFLDSNQIKEIADSGLVSIGSHTLNHPSLKNISDQELERELKDSKEQLEKLINKNVDTICYPTGSYDAKTIMIASKYYKYGIAIKNDVERMNNKFNKYAIKRYRMYRNTSFDDFKKKVDMAN